jgi:hypothetical protein
MYNIIIIIDENYDKNIPPLQTADLILPHAANNQVALTKKGVPVNLSSVYPPFTWLQKLV